MEISIYLVYGLNVHNQESDQMYVQISGFKLHWFDDTKIFYFSKSFPT